MRIITALVLSLIFTPVSPASAEDNGKNLDHLQRVIHDLCVTPDKRGTFLNVEGDLNADATLKVVGVSGKAKINKQDWDGINQTLDKYSTDPRACAISMMRMLAPMMLRQSNFSKTNDITAKRPETDATRLQSFMIHTSSSEVSPGYRKWLRVRPDTWEETYQDGTKHKIYVLKRIHVGDCDGTVVGGKIDRDFQIFLPDKNCDTRALFFRRISQGAKWVQYTDLESVK